MFLMSVTLVDRSEDSAHVGAIGSVLEPLVSVIYMHLSPIDIVCRLQYTIPLPSEEGIRIRIRLVDFCITQL